MDGLNTLRKIRKFDKEIPVVMLTGYATGKLQIAALKLGVNDFLIKGISGTRFLNAIKDIIERQKVFIRKKKTPEKGGRVMVVDDDHQIVKLLEDFLRQKKHEVRAVSSGEEALDVLKNSSYQPDVILVDIKLPGMDGLMTLKKIRKLDSEIKIIVITGTDEITLKQQALELGALECCLKPFDLEHLELTIRIRGMGRQPVKSSDFNTLEEEDKDG